MLVFSLHPMSVVHANQRQSLLMQVFLKWFCCRLEKYLKPAKLKPMSTCPTSVKECYNTIVFTVWIIHWQINVLPKDTLRMYRTSKKKTNSRFNILYILKLNQVDDKHQKQVKFSKMRKALDFRTSEMETSGPFSWNAGPSPLGASPGRPSCHLLHSQTPKTKQWEICICQNHTAKLLLNTPVIVKGLHLPGLFIFFHALGLLSISSCRATTLLLLMLLVLLVFLLFLMFLFLLLFLFLCTTINIWVLWQIRFLWWWDVFVNKNTNDVLSINISRKYNAKTGFIWHNHEQK